jgi:hypothetical protein
MSIVESSLVTDAADFVLYAQHGWADNRKAIAALAQAVATPKTRIIALDLGWVNTWIGIESLIQQVERSVINTISIYPKISIRIIGHSMGGLIWLEVLSRHPEWWLQVDSLVLIASPVGGADLGRIFDPLGIGIGIAPHLGRNRRQMAESIAKVIPTLVIAGDIDNGSDGTITVETTKFAHAKFICLPGLSHPALKNHPIVVEIIRNFWAKSSPHLSPTELSSQLIQRLRLVSGMTDAHRRDFYKAKPYMSFKNGITILTWKNPLQVDHVFVANSEGQCLFSGFVGWIHAEDLYITLQDIKKQYHHL